MTQHLTDAQFDRFIEEGETAYLSIYDTGEPGNSGSNSVSRLDGLYLAEVDDEPGEDAYDTLQAAITSSGANHVNSCFLEVTSDELTHVQLAELLFSTEDPAFSILLNGVSYTYHGEGAYYTPGQSPHFTCTT